MLAIRRKLLLFLLVTFSALLLLHTLIPPVSGPRVAQSLFLLPLDSRPCNTDYVRYAAQAAGKNLEYPIALLDQYTIPADTQKLLQQARKALETHDTFIIYTNQAINGGLIASRDPASYINLESKLDLLEDFLLEAHKQKKLVIVLTVLPRIIPSQFTDLWEHKEGLMEYSKEYGKTGAPPANSNGHIPTVVLERYLSVFQNTDLLVSRMKELVDQGVIDYYIIGQDDTERYSISNLQIRKYQEEFVGSGDRILIQPGADELTKLVIAKLLRIENNRKPLTIHTLYMDPAGSQEIKDFEAYTIEMRSRQLLSFLGIQEDPLSPNIAVIHNTAGLAAETRNVLSATEMPNYRSLIDIAYINRGDIALFENLGFIRHLNGYSGWNTVGNSFGSEYANLVIYEHLQRTLSHAAPALRQSMLENYHKLLYIHFADDYLYQGVLRNLLNQHLLNHPEDPSFIKDKELASLYLQELMNVHSLPLNEALNGEYRYFGLSYQIHFQSPVIYLPWKRTFEAKIVPRMELQIN